MSKSAQKVADIKSIQAIIQANKIIYVNGCRQVSCDQILVEQPLQIKLFWDENSICLSRVFSITMRTPGNDKQLILGLLLSEGVIRFYDDIVTIIPEYGDKKNEGQKESNLWEVKLKKGIVPELALLDKYQMTYSSCGLCGTTSIKSLELKNPPLLNQQKHWLNIDKISVMPDIMRDHQHLFKSTGGSHAAALFDENSQLIDIHEDIGRHNALDKLLGAQLERQAHNSNVQKNNLEVKSTLNCVVVSSRISFEIVQKTIMSGIPILIAVGAPSDLSILVAQRFDLTLIGFVSSNSFNIYHGEWRLQSQSQESLCQKI